MKAIETIYNGYRFRSRLEARWAVFFDTLDVEYQYEKEGYILPDGTRYLPDFWLPGLRKFVEIKPDEPSLEEAKKCCELAKASENVCILVFGQPWMYERKATSKCDCCELDYEWEYRFYLFEGNEFDLLPSFPPGDHTPLDLDSLDKHVFAECRRCPTLGALILDDHSLQGHWSFCRCTDKEPYGPTRRLMSAYTAARQARFE